jgi:nitrile hydratase
LLAPHVYLTSSYYKRWFLRLQQALLQNTLVDVDEIAAGHALRPGKPLKRGKFSEADVDRVMTRGSFGRTQPAPARFKPGDRVRARNIHPTTHTRLPRYVRGHPGTVERLHGCHVFPDSVVLGKGEDPQWLYTVCFEGRELWGADADSTLTVSIEAFEPYLERV